MNSRQKFARDYIRLPKVPARKAVHKSFPDQIVTFRWPTATALVTFEFDNGEKSSSDAKRFFEIFEEIK